MTKDGLRASRFAFPRRRVDRVPLFISGPCRCIGLHRDYDAVRARADDYSSDCAGAQHSGCVHWRVPILARRTFRMEIILAVRAAIDSGRVFWRPPATVDFRLEDSDRAGAAFSAGALIFRPNGPEKPLLPLAPAG